MRVETIGDCTLYLGRCEEVLTTVKPASIITDPPYGMSHKCNFAERGRGSRSGYRNGKPCWINSRSHDYPDIEGDNEPFDPSPLLQAGVSTVLWGANWFADRLPPTSGWLVWDKLRPDDLDQATCELAWTNCVKGVRRFAHLWNGFQRATESGLHLHPTQKPVALFDWILSLPWIPQGLVFDGYMGSGPCGVACVKAGLPYVGCETNETYFETACRRIEAATRLAKCDLFKSELPTVKQTELEFA